MIETMNDDMFLRGLRARRETLVARIATLEGGGVISGDPKLSDAALLAYKQELVELDATIAAQESRGA